MKEENQIEWECSECGEKKVRTRDRGMVCVNSKCKNNIEKWEKAQIR